jgi:triacylglycerol lipase
VHIISHSQGGQTARQLEILLKETYSGEGSPLLSNNYKGWIKSITTISTPHNGSTLVPILLDAFPFSLNLAPWFGSIDSKAFNNFYNFDLEHWGLKKSPNESFDNFISRLSESKLNNQKNLCSWELSINGAKEFNKLYEEDMGVYYFSFTTSATKLKNNSLFHKPDSVMSLHLWPTGLLMGSYSDAIDSTWYENDGVVNSVSMSHPFGSNILHFDGTPIKGFWQSMDDVRIDHQSIIGHGVSKKENVNIFALYKNHCSLLYTLE